MDKATEMLKYLKMSFTDQTWYSSLATVRVYALANVNAELREINALI